MAHAVGSLLVGEGGRRGEEEGGMQMKWEEAFWFPMYPPL